MPDRAVVDETPWYQGTIDAARCVRPSCTHGYGVTGGAVCPECRVMRDEACARLGTTHEALCRRLRIKPDRDPVQPRRDDDA